MEIYILINEKAQGPYTRELVLQYLNSGQFKSTDLAAYAGSADWKPLSAMMQSWAGPGKGTRFSPGAAAPVASSKRKSAAAIAAVVLVLVLGAAGFVLWKSHGTKTGTMIDGDTSSEAGLPKSYAELNAWYVEPPEGQNAATFFAKGFDALQISQADQDSNDLPVLGKGSLPPPGTPLPSRMKASIAALVQRNEAAWAALEQGADLEKARYPIDLSRGAETLLPHLTKIKRVAQFAQLKTAMCVDDKQPQGAADALLVSLAVGQSLKDEPILISQLVRVACCAIETANLQNVINSVALSPSDLERLSVSFSKAESEDSVGRNFSRALVAERVGCLALFDMPPDKRKAELKSFEGQNNMTGVSAENMMQNLKAQRAFAEETFNHALAMRQEPFPERSKVDDYFSTRATEAINSGYYVAQIFLTGLGKGTRREAAGLSNLRLAQTAIALERFRQSNGGSYPDSLAKLAPAFLPEVPLDPFDGNPLRYQINGEGYEMHSIGADPAKPISFKVTKVPKLAL